MNQTQGYWLLSDALVAAFTMVVTLQAQYNSVASMNPPLCCGDFDSDIEVLKCWMGLEVVKVLAPFLSFAVRFSSDKAHNMLALMLDLRFKSLDCIIQYVGVDRARAIVQEYDNKFLIPYLVRIHRGLNPAVVATVEAADPKPVNCLFGGPSSTQEATEGLLIATLSVFRRLCIPSDQCAAPLVWWHLNGPRFPALSFLARQILAIPGSQIETERIFSVAGIFTSLRRCRLGFPI